MTATHALGFARGPAARYSLARRAGAWAGVLGVLALALSQTAAAQVVEYYHLDALGSIRAVSNQAGQLVERHDYLPFGEECVAPPCSGVAGTNTRKFTGKERDGETGLDYFGARYYGSKIGRFTTVDPTMTIKANVVDPQRWNRHSYGRNNPLRFIDPDGRDVTIARSSYGGVEGGFDQVIVGLRSEDRAHVHLQGSAIIVDHDYRSDSQNFQTLKSLAEDHSAFVNINILRGDDGFAVLVPTGWSATAGQTIGTATTTANESGGFTGYTFYPRAHGAPGPWATGTATEVIVNADRDWTPSTIQHELRHVSLGDFGRRAPYGKHGTGSVNRETRAAEQEAVQNFVTSLKKNQ